LHEKYLLPKEEADLIASFLNPMLRLHPDKRATAGEMKDHAWLSGTIVQGEIDVIRRAEEEERRKKLEQLETRNHKACDDVDVDAMKPVDDSAALGDMPSGSKNLHTATTIPANASLQENILARHVSTTSSTVQLSSPKASTKAKR
jgi:serine/threonine-protein kinase SRPK3